MLPKRLVSLLRIQSPIEFLSRYATKPKHLLHIGAHLLEESENYARLGIEDVSWVEANIKLEPINVNRFPDARVLYRAVTDVGNSSVVLNLTSNSVSSSIFHIDPASSFSQIEESESLEVLTESLDSVYAWANNSAKQKVDSILIDVQGAEGLILRGKCMALCQIDTLVIEVSHNTFYIGADSYINVRNKLKASGLCKVTSFINPLTGHGDELWISKQVVLRKNQKLFLIVVFRNILLALARYYEKLILSKQDK